MIIITNLTSKTTGEEKRFIREWYDGSYKFNFYDTETKESYSRTMDMYRAKKFLEQRDILHPTGYYISIHRRCLKIAEYIDFAGVWNREDLDMLIQVRLSETKGLDIDYFDDDIGFFIILTDKFHVQGTALSIVEALFEAKHIIVDDVIYINAVNDVVYTYKIEDVKNFDALYTKLKVMGVGR